MFLREPTTRPRAGSATRTSGRRGVSGNEALSSYLNCGESFTGPVANNYRIYISLISVVRPDGKGASELETAFSAQAQNMEGTSADRIACGSTGRLEERIRKTVLLKVGAVPT